MNQSLFSRSLSVAALCGLTIGCSDAGYGDEGIDLVEQRSQCGPTWNAQDVEPYDGTLAVTKRWVERHEGAVGYHATNGCSGTLISDDLFLSAGHCEYEVGHVVQFNYQYDPSRKLRTRHPVQVIEVLEQENNASYDYAIVRLSGKPGQMFGHARLANRDEVPGDTVALIGHANAAPKTVHTGPVIANPTAGLLNWFSYTVDTDGGSSGSGVLSMDGYLIGVHTDEGCNTSSNPGGNRGMRLSQLMPRSPTLRQVLATQVGGHGWVRAINPSTASYTPAPADQFNSNDGTNTIRRTAVGSYVVTFPGIGAPASSGDGQGGNVQVVASTPNTYCKVRSWGASANVSVDVRCFNAAGSPTDARFVALYHRAGFEGFAKAHGTSAYLWSNQLSYGTPTNASTAYSQNDSGRTNTILKTSTGRYEVTLNGVDVTDASLLITAYGSTNARCQALPWMLSGGSVRVYVACSTPSGAATDSLFTLAYTGEGVPGRFGGGDNAGAYAYAEQPTQSNYTPLTGYQGNSFGGNLTVQRNGTGDYLVRIPQGERVDRGAVLANSYGVAGQHCAVDSWTALSTETQARLFCFDGSGSPADSRFTLTYLSWNLSNP